MPVGIHLSIGGGLSSTVQKAAAMGCDVLQVFVRNPRGWRARSIGEDEAAAVRDSLKKSGVSFLVIHTPYLINLAASDERIYSLSIEAVKEDLAAANLIGADFVVTHIGSTKGGDLLSGTERVINALHEIVKGTAGIKSKLLLENSSGSGSHLGNSMKGLGELILPFKNSNRVGVCIDTCHAFAAGYPFDSKKVVDGFAREVDRFIGFDYLSLLHINDSRRDLGSRIDIHEHIGKGFIGLKGFSRLVNHPQFRDIPMVLETPKDKKDDDAINIGLIKGLFHKKKGSLKPH